MTNEDHANVLEALVEDFRVLRSEMPALKAGAAALRQQAQMEWVLRTMERIRIRDNEGGQPTEVDGIWMPLPKAPDGR